MKLNFGNFIAIAALATLLTIASKQPVVHVVGMPLSASDFRGNTYIPVDSRQSWQVVETTRSKTLPFNRQNNTRLVITNPSCLKVDWPFGSNTISVEPLSSGLTQLAISGRTSSGVTASLSYSIKVAP